MYKLYGMYNNNWQQTKHDDGLSGKVAPKGDLGGSWRSKDCYAFWDFPTLSRPALLSVDDQDACIVYSMCANSWCCQKSLNHISFSRYRIKRNLICQPNHPDQWAIVGKKIGSKGEQLLVTLFIGIFTQCSLQLNKKNNEIEGHAGIISLKIPLKPLS